MRKLVIICCLLLTLGYASSTKGETINQAKNSEINEIEYLSLSEFLNALIEKLY